MTGRVLLLLPTTSYKAQAFLDAAEQLELAVIVGTNHRQSLERDAPGQTLRLDFTRPQRAVEQVRRLAEHAPLDAVVGVDDETTIVAAAVAADLGLRHNPVEAVRASRDKFTMRQRFAAAGLDGPRFHCAVIAAGPRACLPWVQFPCVLKPLFLSAGRGVIRADDAATLAHAFRRIESILAQPDIATREGDASRLLIEDYMPGFEVALEGLLDGGRLELLALFDKPDPLEGPVFEETLLITPSRLPPPVQQAVADEVQRGCAALGLVEGPVHAELRVDSGRPRLLEIAPRTIGGLCSRTLRFGTGRTLEQHVLCQALGRGPAREARETGAAGVMMIPVPRAGTLRGVRGLAAARQVAGVEEVTLTVHVGSQLVPLPEGHQYVGFIFARGARIDGVEAALREAHARLRFDVA